MAAASTSSTSPIKLTGQLDWSGGVDSIKDAAIQSPQNPNGLGQAQLAWLNNGTVRNGGISQRAGWKLKGTVVGFAQASANLLGLGSSLVQGGMFYEPDTGTPYIIALVGGHVIQIDPDFVTQPVDLSAQFGLYMPATNPKAYFVQAESYFVIQAGDNVTLPLFWNGTLLYQSNGITGVIAVGQPVARTFQITSTASWTEGAISSQSTPVYLSAPYLGKLGDNIYITDTALNQIGHFRVTTITASYLLLTSQQLPGAPATIPAETMVVTLELPLAVGPNGAGSSATVALGAGSWVVPAVGKQVNIGLQAYYFGEVGDTVTIASTDNSKQYGTYTVISFDQTPSIRLQLVAAGNQAIGQSVTQSDLNVTITAVRSFASTWTTANGWTVPPAGSTVSILAQRFTPAYGGVVGDYVSITIPSSGETVGLFQYTAAILPGAETGAGSTFECIASANVGQILGQGSGVKMTCTVVGPNGGVFPYTQTVLMGVGSWTIPPVGSTTGPATGQLPLNIYWQYNQQGVLNAYPGNVGDTITLTQTTPAEALGTFVVVAFDGAGGITLKTVASNFVGTVFTGPMIGVLTITQAPSTTGTLINQLPAATQMGYYMGRIWYNQNGIVNAGDIVGGPSGTSAVNFKDSVLCVTENPLVLGGDGFALPSQSGPITGIAFSNAVDAAMGQGLLYIGTARAIYALQVPVSRSDWINANSNNQPQMVCVQLRNGWVNDRSIVQVNGDLYYQSNEPGIRSLIQALRYFGQAGNVQISSDIYRILKFTDRTLMDFASGILFDNRLLECLLPIQTAFGVVHQAIAPLDFEPLSTLESKLPPVWEGMWQGLQIFQLLEATFNGVDRAFAIVLSQSASSQNNIELWELTTADKWENAGTSLENRVTWQIDFPSYAWGEEFRLKKLVTAELWLDSLLGTVDFTMEFRPDSSSCWIKWHSWQLCAARDSSENVNNPIAYPLTQYDAGFLQTGCLPNPPADCQTFTGRPSNQGYQFQCRLTIKGQCRIQGLMLGAEMMDRKTFDNLLNDMKPIDV